MPKCLWCQKEFTKVERFNHKIRGIPERIDGFCCKYCSNGLLTMDLILRRKFRKMKNKPSSEKSYREMCEDRGIDLNKYFKL